MRVGGPIETRLVVAAQAGDRRALDELIAAGLPATIAVGTLAAGAAITVTNLPMTASPPATFIAAPALARPERATPSSVPQATSTRRPTATEATTKPPVTGTVSPRPGQPLSLESADEPGLFVSTADDLGVLTPVRTRSALDVRRQATFTVIEGLAKPSCFSFRAPNGHYLRHASWRFRLDPDQGTPLFRSDRGDELWVDQANASPAFRAESSFRLRPPLAR